MKKFSFFFHYNKPRSKQLGRPQISLHYRGTCYIVDNVICKTGTEGRIRNRQPFFVMVGKASEIQVIDNIAHIS